MARSGLERQLEKQRREERELERKKERQEYAKGIVVGARFVSGFRVMDRASEDLLGEILAQYNGREDNYVKFDTTVIPEPIREFAYVGYEALKMYGMICSVVGMGNSAGITLLESGKRYFDEKANAEDREKMVTGEGQVPVSIQGNENTVMIQNNTTNSAQTNGVESDVDFETVDKILEQIFRYQKLFKEEFGDQSQQLEDALVDARTASGERESGRLKKALGTVKSILENFAGSLIATGVLAALAKLPFLL